MNVTERHLKPKFIIMKPIIKFLLGLGVALGMYAAYLTYWKNYGSVMRLGSGKIESHVGLAAYKKHARGAIVVTGRNKGNFDDEYQDAQNTRDLFLAGAVCSLLFAGVFYAFDRNSDKPVPLASDTPAEHNGQ